MPIFKIVKNLKNYDIFYKKFKIAKNFQVFSKLLKKQISKYRKII